MLQINKLHAEADGKPILNGLSHPVNTREVHAIVGPKAANKSMLACVFGGALR